jgi:hypothetical protein
MHAPAHSMSRGASLPSLFASGSEAEGTPCSQRCAPFVSALAWMILMAVVRCLRAMIHASAMPTVAERRNRRASTVAWVRARPSLTSELSQRRDKPSRCATERRTAISRAAEHSGHVSWIERGRRQCCEIEMGIGDGSHLSEASLGPHRDARMFPPFTDQMRDCVCNKQIIDSDIRYQTTVRYHLDR